MEPSKAAIAARRYYAALAEHCAKRNLRERNESRSSYCIHITAAITIPNAGGFWCL